MKHLVKRLLVILVAACALLIVPGYASAAVSLTVSPTSVTGGGSITSTWDGVTSPTHLDWIGVYNHSGGSNTDYIDWWFDNSGTKIAGSTSPASGSVSHIMPTTPGTYYIRLYANDGYTLLTEASTPVTVSSATTYPLHTNIVSTTFWVGEIFDANIADGSQVCSTYDSQWAFHWSGGINIGTDPSTDCAGAPIGGCDGVPTGTGSDFQCATQARTSASGFFPTSSSVNPAENPFYLDLPFDDVNDPIAFAERCSVIPWAMTTAPTRCSDPNYSYMKDNWVKITGPNSQTCYGQIEDAGPSHGSLYHDAAYVFGADDAQPIQRQFNNAGMDVSPALNGCLGFADLDGDTDHVSWQFVDASAVPAGPWLNTVTTRQVS